MEFRQFLVSRFIELGALNHENRERGTGNRERRFTLSNHVYKTVELVGSSPNGSDDAVRNAIARAGATVRNLRWFEVIETRGHIENEQIAHWQVTIKVGFTLDEA